jgi:hypothetical protein
MQTVPEIVIEDVCDASVRRNHLVKCADFAPALLPTDVEEGTNYGSSGSGSDSGSDCEQTMSQTDLLNELDVVVVYLNSKSLLFRYSAVRVQNYRCLLYGSSFLLSGSMTFLPIMVSHGGEWLLILISIFGFLISGITVGTRYANFDITIQKYCDTAASYHRLENEMMLFKSVNTYSYEKYRLLYEKIRESEVKIIELNNKAELSASIRKRFPDIDIFAQIHKIEEQRKKIARRLTSVRYEIRKLAFDIDSENIDPEKKARLKFLIDSKKKIKDELENVNYSSMIEKMESERSHYSDNGWFIHL